MAWFIIEFVVRFLSSPSRAKFCQDGMNLVDLAAILPYFITITLDVLIESAAPIADSKILRPQMATFLRLVRILRMLRILKLSRYSRGLRILGMTLYRSARVLTLLGISPYHVLASYFGQETCRFPHLSHVILCVGVTENKTVNGNFRGQMIS